MRGLLARLGETVDGASCDDFAAWRAGRTASSIPLQRDISFGQSPSCGSSPRRMREHRLHRRRAYRLLSTILGDLAAPELDDHAHAVPVGLHRRRPSPAILSIATCTSCADALDEGAPSSDLEGQLGDHRSPRRSPSLTSSMPTRRGAPTVGRGWRGRRRRSSGAPPMMPPAGKSGPGVRWTSAFSCSAGIIQQRDARVDGLGDRGRVDSLSPC